MRRLRALTCRLPATAALVLSITSCRGDDGSEARVEALLGTLDEAGRSAQLVILAASVQPRSQDAIVDAAKGATGRPGIGGIWIESGEAAAVARLATGVRAATNLPPLLFVDVDEGLGRTIHGASTFPPLGRLLLAAEPDELREAGEIIGAEAALLGIDIGVLRGPPTTGGVEFSGVAARELPDRLTALLAGSARRDLLITLLLFWSSAPAAGPVTWDRARLSAFELPLLAAAAGDAAALLPGELVLPALTGDTMPLRFSASAMEMLRAESGWTAPILVDLRGVSTDSLGDAVVRAIGAGADAVIVPDSAAPALRALAAATSEGRLDAGRIAAAARRILRLKLRAADESDFRVPPDSVMDHLPRPEAAALADLLAERLLRGPAYRSERETLPIEGAVVAPVEPDSVGMSEVALKAADESIEEGIEEGLFTAAALAVGRRGGLVRLRGYGTIQENGEPVDPNTTLFDLASLTKVVGTTTATALLIESGDLELDEPVRRYVPEFEGEGKGGVTIRHLLAHTSGLPPGLWLYGSAASAEEAMQQVIRQPLRRPPGVQPEYSDLGLILLAEIVERASGTTIDRLLAERLFTPLNIAATMYLPPLALHSRTIATAIETERPFPLQGVVHDGNAYRLAGIAGHAGLFSTAHDLAVFAQMMLNGGSYGALRVLSASTVDELTSKQPNAEGRALGWDTPADRSSAGRFFSASSFGHTGYTGTSLWIDPERDLFVVLLTNRTFTETSAEDILDVRIAVHEAAARAIVDEEIVRRAGAR